MLRHTSVNCPKLKSGGPQNKVEHMGKWYQSMVNMQNLPRLYKIRKEPILDPEATMHQQAGTSIWCHDTTKKAQMKQYKNVARDQCNINWHSSRRDDLELEAVVNQSFGANEVEIKQKPRMISDFSGRLIPY
jgi:hypothetical protein